MANGSITRVVVLEADDEGVGVEAALGAWPSVTGGPTTLALKPGGAEGPAADRMLEALREFVRRAAEGGLEPRPAALALPAGVDSPTELALEAAAACPGAPAVYLVLPAAALEAIQRRGRLCLAEGRETCARVWWSGMLALAAAVPGVSLVPAVAGPGLSPLAGRSGWAGPAPGLGELVPASAHRLRLDLDFGELLAGADDRPCALARRAGELVEASDARLGPGSGPRRLALHLQGVAEAVLARGLDPERFEALTWLGARLRAFRDGARAASVALARRLGPAGGVAPFPVPPALKVADSGVLERAVLAHGARHSHLVCLSPWSLAPPGLGRAGLNLLPALAWADSIAWRRPAGELSGYGEALRFAWAVARKG